MPVSLPKLFGGRLYRLILLCVVVFSLNPAFGQRPNADRLLNPRHRFDFLDRSGFEPKDSVSQFHELEISDRVLYFHQRVIRRGSLEAIVQEDQVAYHFDRANGRLRDFRIQWRDDLPDELPEVIDRPIAEAVVVEHLFLKAARQGKTTTTDPKFGFAGLYYLSPDSETVLVQPVPRNPCWILHVEQNDSITALVVDAIEGRVVGEAVPPPAEGFTLSGPLDTGQCTGTWYSWYTSAKTSFEKLGYPTEAVQYPSQEKLIVKLQSLKTSLFYEIAHGGSTSFANACKDSTYPSEITEWLRDLPPMPFAFIGSCDGMCNTGSGTLSSAFRKGLLQNTTTIGYCRMSNEPCVTNCWYGGYTIPWQTKFFDLLGQGQTMQEAFHGANTAFPGCSNSSCMRFAGDPDLRLVPVISRNGTLERIYVDDDAIGANNGSSWANAFVNLSDAISAAGDGTEIWVAEGFYVPRQGGLGRDTAFRLKEGVKMYGGLFSGATSLAQQNPAQYVTLLSGDLDGNDTDDPATRSDNTFHVVIANNVTYGILDGFAIMGGNADGDTYDRRYGGGVYCENSSPTIRNCTISENICAERGGGLFVLQNSSPKIEQCRLIRNRSGVIGGGIASYGAILLTDCAFDENQSRIGGGLWGTVGSIDRCRFLNNNATQDGGGLYAIADMTFRNCIFAGNEAAKFGGGIYAIDCTIEILHGTLTMNHAKQYGGFYNDEGSTYVLHSIFRNNTDTSNCLYGAQIDGWKQPVVEYSCVTGWTTTEGGIGNFDVDPLFADIHGNDFHLQSAAGRWNPNTKTWINDSQTSRCIDAGSPGMGIGQETSANGLQAANVRINLGAYGGTPEASRTPIGWEPLSDMNNDGRVGMEDLETMSRAWILDGTPPFHADLNRDTFVDEDDLAQLANEWLVRATWRMD